MLGAGFAVSLPGLAGITQQAQASDTKTLRSVALHRTGESYKKWHWLDERLQKETDGRYSLEIVTADELGMSGTEFLRVLRSGMIDFAEITTGYVSGDFPMIEASELPGLASNYDDYQEITDAWMTHVVAENEDRMGGKVISSFAWGPMHLYSTFPVDELSDLEGKKIRVFSSSQAKYLEELGAEPMSLPMTELYGALQRGLIDGMVTGAEHIGRMSLWETTSHVSDIGIAPASGYIVVSQRTWDALPDEVQAAIEGFADEFSNEGWRLGMRNAELGFEIAQANGMNLDRAQLPEAWWSDIQRASQEVVLPWWPTRVSDRDEAAHSFNAHIAPLSGTRIE
ncbi:TRAP transporter substrate-binding protein [Halomonas sp. HK25]|uniref:TRAP transporter substrate-binding protein n=1 Tax=Halomonas sp. HK25 TaxID=3394321 RepID=UPI0039FD99E3